MQRGNNGEIVQLGRRVLELGDWWYNGSALRAEYQGDPRTYDDCVPMRVILRNGDLDVVHAAFMVSGVIYTVRGLVLLTLRPV